MQKELRINMLLKAQGKINEAINSLKLAMDGTGNESDTEAGIIHSLDTWANSREWRYETIPALIDYVNDNYKDWE